MNILSRTVPLLTEKGLAVLKNSAVAVFGLGGVGGFTAEALARSGVGTLYLADGDRIDETNINRQIYALHSTVGLYKTEAAQKRIADINPHCSVHIFTAFILPDKDGSLSCIDFFDNLDFIVDATDTIALKTALAAEAEKRRLPVISAAGCGNRLSAADFEFADIFQTSGCPLCRTLRQNLKKKGVKGLKVLYSKTAPDCANRPPASTAWTPAAAGLMIAEHVVRTLCSI